MLILEKLEINSINFDSLLLILLVGVLIVYSLFSFLVYKQVGILNKAIHTTHAKQLRELALLSIFGAIGLLVVSLALLLINFI